MQYKRLGNTGIEVSRLCFGTLTISPLQANLSPAKAQKILLLAMRRGVNFFDCAELYQTYPLVGEAMRQWGKPAVVVGRSYAWERAGMRQSLAKALKELGRDYVDIFLLHEMESWANVRGHWEALEYLHEAKAQGLVRAVGVSTHYVEVVRSAADCELIEVIHPLYNHAGLGIRGGSAVDMLDAIRYAVAAGKGIYGMKALGGGHLAGNARDALQKVLDQPEFAAVAVGMRSSAQVLYNSRVFSGLPVSGNLEQLVRARTRRIHVDDWCRGCGECTSVCPAGAITVKEAKATVDAALCIFCGYCGAACPEFCIKVI